MGNKVINTTSVKLQIYETSTDEQLEGMLGDVKEMEDGRKFRLCHNSTAGALAPGYLVQSKIEAGNLTGLTVATTVAAGATSLSVTVDASHEALSVNELKDGYLVVDTGSGELGHARKIKANTAAAAEANTTITFYDALTDSITDTSTVAWVYPIYKNVIANVISAKPIGVTVCDVAASTSTVPVFFWAQVAGPCAVLCTGTVTRGYQVAAITGGGVSNHSTTAAHIGVAMQSFSTGEIGWINLNLE